MVAGPAWNAVRRLLAPLLENRCPACSMPVPATPGAGEIPLCGACAAFLTRRTAGYCSRCGNLTASPDLAPAPCGACLATERSWDAFFFHGEYQDTLRELILRFKSSRELPLAALLGGLLAAHPGITGPYDAIVPLPLHVRRLRERGFNQTAELARPLAKRLGARIDHAALVRLVYTHPQPGLTLEERRRNVRGIFRASPSVRGLRLLLIDDIATTCATVESAAAALKKAGAASVDVAVLARTPENETPPSSLLTQYR